MNNLKEICFFDLDNTLWYVKSRVWVIHKNDPSKPIMKINNQEFTLIKNGVYISDNNVIKFDGNKYFVSDDFVKRLQRKRKNIKLSDVGISYAEHFDEDILNKKDVQFLLDNIKHLIGTGMEIGLLSARTDRNIHAEMLNKLRLKLKEYGFEISKIYFVSNRIRFGSSDDITYNKNDVILEHLIGLEIDENKFIPIKKDAYNRIYFYDDAKHNFLTVNDMQSYFEELLYNSEDEVVQYIQNRLEDETLIIVNNLITNNQVNPFDTKIIKLRKPIKYPISVEKFVSNFDDFIKLY